MSRRALVAAIGILSLGCSEHSPAGPTQAAGPVTPPPVAQPSTSWSVSGTVWVHSRDGVAPATAGAVFGWIETANGGGMTTGRVPIAADGRYLFNIDPGIPRVRVTKGITGYQPCAVTREPTGSVSVDTHIVTDAEQLGANLPAELLAQGPTLSGVVYEQTSNGRRPVPNVWVSLDGAGGLGLVIADTLTDYEGRYVLCGVPHLPGLTLGALATGFELFEYYNTDLIGRTTLDVELRRKTP